MAYRRLTYEQAEEIRKLFATSTVTLQAIADKYSVDRSTIGKIVNNRTWKYDPESADAPTQSTQNTSRHDHWRRYENR